MGTDFTMPAAKRIQNAVKWVERQQLTGGGQGGMRGNNAFRQDGLELRAIRINEEVCNGYYKGIEIGFRDQVSAPTFFTWHDLDDQGVWDSGENLLMEFSQRENIPVGTLIFGYPDGVAVSVNGGSDERPVVKWIFQWQGNEGDFMANPYYDSDGLRYFHINPGLVQIGDFEKTVAMKMIQIDNPFNDCDESPTPEPDPPVYYWVEATATYDCECPFWKWDINDQLQSGSDRPDLWEMFRTEGDPEEEVEIYQASPSPDCDGIDKIIWRFLIGEVNNEDWIQHACGNIQHHSWVPWDMIEGWDKEAVQRLVNNAGCVEWAVDPFGPGGCAGVTQNRVLDLSGEVFIDGVKPDLILKQNMIRLSEVWVKGRLCSYTIVPSVNVIGPWCCDEFSPEPENPSPSPNCLEVCIEGVDWSEEDLNGTYTFNPVTEDWEQNDGLGFIRIQGDWIIGHPTSTAANNEVYSGLATTGDCPTEVIGNIWAFNGTPGTGSNNAKVNIGQCDPSPSPSCLQICVVSDWDIADLNGTYTYNSVTEKWEQDDGDAEIEIDGNTWVLTHPASTSADDDVYQAQLSTDEDNCPTDALGGSPWTFTAPNGTQTNMSVQQEPCVSPSPGNCDCVDLAAGAGLWLCAENLGLSEGDPVGTWTDLSGNGNDAVTIGVGEEGTFRENESNGHPAVQFDDGAVGKANVVAPHHATIDLSENMTIIMVIKPDGSASNVMMHKGSIGGPEVKCQMNVNKPQILLKSSAFNQKFTTSDNTISQTNYTVVTFRVTSLTTQEIWHDGVLQTTTNFSQGTLASVSSTTGLTVGCENNSSGAPNKFDFSDGITDIVVFKTAISDVLRAEIEDCFIAKYAL